MVRAGAMEKVQGEIPKPMKPYHEKLKSKKKEKGFYSSFLPDQIV